MLFRWWLHGIGVSTGRVWCQHCLHHGLRAGPLWYRGGGSYLTVVDLDYFRLWVAARESVVATEFPYLVLSIFTHATVHWPETESPLRYLEYFPWLWPRRRAWDRTPQPWDNCYSHRFWCSDAN